MSETAERERTLASRLRIAIVRLNRRLRAQTESSVTLSQMSALACLWRNGPLAPRELAAHEGVQPPSMTRVIAALEDLGLVYRRQHPTDGRQAIVELTEAGNQRMEQEVSVREQWLDLRLAELTDQERDTLSSAARILERMAR
ncbi:DNA-binding transcriptional regulator, MarR family [Actinopolyspora lacussalsi subsp. righensis]|uniref:DNA-binding transcriptional regulator, MarR family n=2 Tax=Actinopolyspora TaxID=1849 RepID=A0A1G9C2F3_ACTMZ|nr:MULTISPECIES: MarR family transcriptional regulator [Actinopolyspora]SDK45833.1 DNA-binding transcriptional regulator, MarR family [Actinopolyspora mzabensis]SFT45465.1 DNA-binding transcriptional regulator, MarR family [Actinopolyspora righensis]